MFLTSRWNMMWIRYVRLSQNHGLTLWMTCAREEWGWKPEYDLDSMTQDMLAKLKNVFQVK